MTKNEILKLRITTEERQAFDKAAAAMSLNISQWVRNVLRSSAYRDEVVATKPSTLQKLDPSLKPLRGAITAPTHKLPAFVDKTGVSKKKPWCGLKVKA
jgi:hypothetical protein